MAKASAFDRGMRAAKKRRLLTSNPFLKRTGKSYVRRAAEWDEGYRSVDLTQAVSLSEFKWLPMTKPEYQQAGDYDRRERGLQALFYHTPDLIEWEILKAEMSVGAVGYVPAWARSPYGVLRAYALTRGDDLGIESEPDTSNWGHPVKYLWSAIQLQREAGHFPSLVTSAYEELKHGSFFEIFRRPNSAG